MVTSPLIRVRPFAPFTRTQRNEKTDPVHGGLSKAEKRIEAAKKPDTATLKTVWEALKAIQDAKATYSKAINAKETS